jgi:CRISPR-associated protein Csd2
MAVRRLIIFKHESVMGNAPSNKLFDMVQVKPKQDTEVIRDFSQHEFTAPCQADMPQGVTIIDKQ